MERKLVAKTYQIKNLGEITASVLQVCQDHHQMLNEIDDDLRAFGAPSECWGIAFKGVDGEYASKVIDTVQSFGVNYTLFKEELVERVDGKWLYMNSVELP